MRPAGKHVARKDFVHGGVTYRRGDEFPLSATSKRVAKMLAEQRFIVPADEGPPHVKIQDVERPFGVTPEELNGLERDFPDEPYALTTDEMAEEQATRPVEARSAELRPGDPGHPYKAVVSARGGGWYDVLVDGEAVNGSPLRKEAAEQLASEQ